MWSSGFTEERDDQGHRLVVRNGHAVARSLVTGAGPIEVRAPRVDDRRVDAETGDKMRFRPSILPPWARKSPKVAEVLPMMYLHGMSSRRRAIGRTPSGVSSTCWRT
jgi:transposase-like protein